MWMLSVSGRIGLWGRSMGAVTALLHGDRDPSIAGMVVIITRGEDICTWSTTCLGDCMKIVRKFGRILVGFCTHFVCELL